MAARPSTRRPAPAPKPGEVSAFKARLKSIPLATLLDKLAGPAQGQQWQRELAQEEADGREPDAESQASAAPPRRRKVPLWGTVLASVLIAASSAVVAYTAYQLWLM